MVRVFRHCLYRDLQVQPRRRRSQFRRNSSRSSSRHPPILRLPILHPRTTVQRKRRVEAGETYASCLRRSIRYPDLFVLVWCKFFPRIDADGYCEPELTSDLVDFET